MLFRKLKIVGLISLFFYLLGVNFTLAKVSNRLEFQLLFEKKEYKIGDPIDIDFKLKNKGKDSVYVNKRFFVGSKESKPEDREVYLQVIGPSGKELEPKETYDTGFPKTDYFVLLNPGEEAGLERKKNLKAYFDFEDPGKYKIIGVYQNVYGAEIGIDAFKEKIKSRPVTIRITE